MLLNAWLVRWRSSPAARLRDAASPARAAGGSRYALRKLRTPHRLSSALPGRLRRAATPARRMGVDPASPPVSRRLRQPHAAVPPALRAGAAGAGRATDGDSVDAARGTAAVPRLGVDRRSGRGGALFGAGRARHARLYLIAV